MPKVGDVARRTRRVQATDINLFTQMTGDRNPLHYDQEIAAGRISVEDEVLVLNRSFDGAPGAWVLTPLALTDGSTIVVNRGWVPSEAKDPARRPAGQVEGSVRIEGLLLPDGAPGWFTPDNRPEQGYFFRSDQYSRSMHYHEPFRSPLRIDMVNTVFTGCNAAFRLPEAQL